MRRMTNTVWCIIASLLLVTFVYLFFQREQDWTGGAGTKQVLTVGTDVIRSDLHSVLENMKRRNFNQPLLVTVINDAYLPFAHNWLCNTLYMHVHHQVLLIATDKTSREELSRQWPEVNVVALSGESFHGNQDYSHAGYVRIMVKRTDILLTILKENFEMLLFDLDTYWRTDPIPEIRRQVEGYDIAAVPVSDRPDVICGGFIFMKPTTRMIKLWTELTHMMLALDNRIKKMDEKALISEGDNDQAYISKLLQQRYADVREKKLSLKEFPDGKWYDLPVSDRQKLSPLVVHNNWIIGNEAKINRAKSFQQWFWDSEHKTCNKDLVILQTVT